MPVVTVLDSFLKTIILVENYRLRFKISGSGPAGTLDSPFTARFERLVRFWTDTLCPPGVTLGHVLASMARLWGSCILLCCVYHVCTYVCVLCTGVWVCAMLCCVVLICCVSVCFCWSVCVILVIFLVFRRMRPNFLDFLKPPFS